MSVRDKQYLNLYTIVMFFIKCNAKEKRDFSLMYKTINNSTFSKIVQMSTYICFKFITISTLKYKYFLLTCLNSKPKILIFLSFSRTETVPNYSFQIGRITSLSVSSFGDVGTYDSIHPVNLQKGSGILCSKVGFSSVTLRTAPWCQSQLVVVILAVSVLNTI